MNFFAILRTKVVILHHFEEDECERLCENQVMECNTLTEVAVLVIDIVALRGKNENFKQNYETHATYSTIDERMN